MGSWPRSIAKEPELPLVVLGLILILTGLVILVTMIGAILLIVGLSPLDLPARRRSPAAHDLPG